MKIMKKPIGLLMDEKFRLQRILEDLDNSELTSSTALDDLGEEIKRDIYMIDEALEAIEKHYKNIY